MASSPVFSASEAPEGNADMVFIEGGTFWMGSDDHYPEEGPAHQVRVDGFWIDAAPVTNREFARFVAETGYVTVAEIAPDPAEYPEADPALLQPGSSLFVRPKAPVPLHDPFGWWQFALGVNWRHPWGPESSLEGLEDHPVVHIAYPDAEAYAAWAGKSLPTEAEWEFAARGGLDRKAFAWGDELYPGGKQMANTWQGSFPFENTLEDGFERTSPVGHFPPNGYGLYDMIGNVWEWTCTPWIPDHRDLLAPPHGGVSSGPSSRQVEVAASSCCGGSQRPGTGADTVKETDRIVTKGGSHLCSPQYCRRYRPAARQGHGVRDTTSHVGFRCVVRTGD